MQRPTVFISILIFAVGIRVLIPSSARAFQLVTPPSPNASATPPTVPARSAPTRDEYAILFPELIGDGHDSMTQALGACTEESGSHWMLRSIGIGLALQLQAGLGPLFSISGSGEVRLIYSNAHEAPTP